jgi:hypothetical protein
VESLVPTLLVWIAVKMGFAVSPPPRIVFVDHTKMSELAHGPAITPNPQLRALYDRRTMTIYLRANWSAVSLVDQSELVHELVHHAQTTQQIPYQCAAAREELAYQLQVAWLKEQGIADPYELLQINHFFVVMVSMCRDVDYD